MRLIGIASCTQNALRHSAYGFPIVSTLNRTISQCGSHATHCIARRPLHQRGWISTSEACTSPTSKDAKPLPTLYQPPRTGSISRLPSSWIPYAELIRLDKPAGTYYLYFPCLFSTLLAAPLASPVSTPLQVVSTGALFFAGALIMRGAGCTVNDLWDRNLDPHVERTRLRPIARRAITPQNAVVYLGFQLLAGLGILLSFPPQCFFYAAPSLLLVFTYPLAKRVTNLPTVRTGPSLLMGGIRGLSGPWRGPAGRSVARAAAGALYASCVAWTLNYDMIYAFMDIKDDVNAGIKSIALAHDHNAKLVLSGLSVVQVGLLSLAGYFAGAGPLFFAGSCGGAAVTLGTMVRE